MTDFMVYDKVKWHYPDGKNCPSLEMAKLHFKTILGWLSRNQLLSDYGKEIANLGVDADTSITSEMVTDSGNLALSQCYDKWLDTVTYRIEPDTQLLDQCLSQK